MRGILLLALTLGGLGAVVLAWPGHAGAGHAQLTVKHRVHSPAHPAHQGGRGLLVTKAVPKPFMY